MVVGDVDEEGFATKLKETSYPSLYRWYGLVSDFALSEDNNVIAIDLESASFAVKVYTDNVPKGWVTWYSNSRYDTYDFCNPVIDADNREVTNVFTFPNIKKPQPSGINLNIVWHCDAEEEKQASTTIDIKPKTMTSLKLNLEE